MSEPGDGDGSEPVPAPYAHLTQSQYRSLILRKTEPQNSTALPFLPQGTNFFVCANCSSPLFPAAAKFASGTGWPSFSSAVPGAIKMKTDWRATEDGKWVLGGRAGVKFRTEAVCANCGGHLGHVFRGEKWEGVQEEDVGKGVTRYCVNGSSLTILPDDQFKSQSPSNQHGESDG
ncbi:Thioredoxin [Orbilia brochopaga]|nr:Thioredoxin [Drechslerella brochopaga]